MNLMEKIAQKRTLLDRFQDATNLKGKLTEHFFNPALKVNMDMIRQVDDSVRTIAAGEKIGNSFISPEPGVSLKALLTSAKANASKKEYMASVSNMSRFRDKFEDIMGQLTKLEAIDPAKMHEEANHSILFGDIKPQDKSELDRLYQKYSNVVSPVTAGAFDSVMSWLAGVITTRGRAIRAWEQMYPEQTKALRTAISNLLESMENTFNSLLSSLNQMSQMRTKRNVEGYLEASKSFANEYFKFQTNFTSFYHEFVEGFLIKEDLINKQKAEENALRMEKLAHEKAAKTAEEAEKAKAVKEVVPEQTPTGTIAGVQIPEDDIVSEDDIKDGHVGELDLVNSPLVPKTPVRLPGSPIETNFKPLAPGEKRPSAEPVVSAQVLNGLAEALKTKVTKEEVIEVLKSFLVDFVTPSVKSNVKREEVMQLEKSIKSLTEQLNVVLKRDRKDAELVEAEKAIVSVVEPVAKGADNLAQVYFKTQEADRTTPANPIKIQELQEEAKQEMVSADQAFDQASEKQEAAKAILIPSTEETVPQAEVQEALSEVTPEQVPEASTEVTPESVKEIPQETVPSKVESSFKDKIHEILSNGEINFVIPDVDPIPASEKATWIKTLDDSIFTAANLTEGKSPFLKSNLPKIIAIADKLASSESNETMKASLESKAELLREAYSFLEKRALIRQALFATKEKPEFKDNQELVVKALSALERIFHELFKDQFKPFSSEVSEKSATETVVNSTDSDLSFDAEISSDFIRSLIQKKNESQLSNLLKKDEALLKAVTSEYEKEILYKRIQLWSLLESLHTVPAQSPNLKVMRDTVNKTFGEYKKLLKPSKKSSEPKTTETSKSVEPEISSKIQPTPQSSGNNSFMETDPLTEEEISSFMKNLFKPDTAKNWMAKAETLYVKYQKEESAYRKNKNVKQTELAKMKKHIFQAMLNDDIKDMERMKLVHDAVQLYLTKSKEVEKTASKNFIFSTLFKYSSFLDTK